MPPALLRRGVVCTTWGAYRALRTSRGVCRLLSPAESPAKLDRWRRAHAPAARVVDDDPAFDDLRTQLQEYLDGARTRFDVPLDLRGTGAQRRAWRALRRVPYGETRTYQQLARAAGLRGARAAGAANGANPVCVLVPCHRIVGSDGRLAGYAGGLAMKKRLLALERAGARRREPSSVERGVPEA